MTIYLHANRRADIVSSRAVGINDAANVADPAGMIVVRAIIHTLLRTLAHA